MGFKALGCFAEGPNFALLLGRFINIIMSLQTHKVANKQINGGFHEEDTYDSWRKKFLPYILTLDLS